MIKVVIKTSKKQTIEINNKKQIRKTDKKIQLKVFNINAKNFNRSNPRIRELALRKIVAMDVKHAALFEALRVCRV